MRSEGYSTWSVCLSVCLSAPILALQATRRPMSYTNGFRSALKKEFCSKMLCYLWHVYRDHLWCATSGPGDQMWLRTIYCVTDSAFYTCKSVMQQGCCKLYIQQLMQYVLYLHAFIFLHSFLAFIYLHSSNFFTIPFVITYKTQLVYV